MDSAINGLRLLVLGVCFSIASIFNELKEAVSGICISDSSINLFKQFSDLISWQELTLEGLIFPIWGIYLVKIWLRITRKNKSVEQIRKELDELNEQLKLKENKPVKTSNFKKRRNDRKKR